MLNLRHLGRRAMWLLFALALWISQGPLAWAQEGDAAAESAGGPVEGKSFAASWAIIMLCMILGMLVTLRPVSRSKEAKRQKKEDH